MPSPVQTVQSTVTNGATSATCTLTATQAGSAIIVLCPVQAGSGISWAVTDNQSNTYTKRADSTIGSGFVNCMIWDCLSPATSGITSVTLTATGHTMSGSITVVEWPAGSISGFDQAGHTLKASGGTPISVTATAADTNAADIVFACMVEQGSGSGDNPTDPPTGFTHLSVTTSGNISANECCYRINSSIVTDTTSWSWSGGATAAAACIVSYIPFTGLTVPQTASNTSTANPVTCTLSGAQSAGAILVMVHSNGNAGTISVTDSVNGSGYVQMGANYYPASGGTCAAFFIKNTAGGTPVIQASNTGSAAMGIMALNVTGFIGTPTFDASSYLGTFSAAASTVTATPASNFNNEILACIINDGSYVSGQPSGWVNVGGTGWYAINAAAGSKSFSATLGASTYFAYLNVGLYDSTAVTPSPIRKVRRQLFTTYYPA